MNIMPDIAVDRHVSPFLFVGLVVTVPVAPAVGLSPDKVNEWEQLQP